MNTARFKNMTKKQLTRLRNRLNKPENEGSKTLSYLRFYLKKAGIGYNSYG